MIDEYINNFEEMISLVFFTSFKTMLILYVVVLIISLLILIIGCLIKSQTIKLKFLKVVSFLILIIMIWLFIPYIVIGFKNII